MKSQRDPSCAGRVWIDLRCVAAKPDPKTTVSLDEARADLSRLMADAAAGREVVIAPDDGVGVCLVPVIVRDVRQRELGWLRDDSRGSDPLDYGFWDPLTDEEMGLTDQPWWDDAPPA